MKNIIILFLFYVTCGVAQTDYIKTIQKHRAELNQYFKNSETSPLPKKKLKTFKSLPFFKVDSKYKVKAKLNYTFNSPITYIQNTDGQTEAYQQYALATFSLNGKNYQLSIYQSMTLKRKRGFENYLFIPFKDVSNGKSTYSGGRYLDTTIPEEPTGYITLDFNKAYNPYCAYNSKFTCPIPPKNNFLGTEVLAGVKKH